MIGIDSFFPAFDPVDFVLMLCLGILFFIVCWRIIDWSGIN